MISRFRLRSTSIKLSLRFAILYSLLVALMFFGAYRLAIYEVRDHTFERMHSDAETLESVFDAHGRDTLVQYIEALQAINFENSRIFRLRDDAGTQISGNIQRADLPAALGTANTGDVQFVPVENIDIDGVHEEEVTGYWLMRSQIGPYEFLQGTGDHVVSEVIEALAVALTLGFVLAIIAGLVTGVWVGRITENRIVSISDTLDLVSKGDLHARIPISDDAHDDLSRVSESINGTLARLETLLETQQQISTDIAHDMRTPLQRLRQRLERLEEQETPDRSHINAALIEVEGIITTFNALLRIAQVESGSRRERFEKVDLNAVAETVFEAFEPAAENSKQKLSLAQSTDPAFVFGDRSLLLQLASNLIENAMRHCPEGTKIDVKISATHRAVNLIVADTGPGVATEDRERIFRRFYRADKSRTSAGHGLGLATVKAIADLHNAEVSLSDNSPGLHVSVGFKPA
ncbi:ATP-binding protein [Ruegeria sp. 2012CJ41-6]|uniref:histidine kinase n=1 Tax=Ruegeria spongiae TaxID=2942209 RepID=A0ABT0Q7I9_9RHOB|nr:ATP-binding protein [Ruegeria spongiae]MCL6285848.1 ATP-binding protein [Ruegeria spongiae]